MSDGGRPCFTGLDVVKRHPMRKSLELTNAKVKCKDRKQGRNFVNEKNVASITKRTYYAKKLRTW